MSIPYAHDDEDDNNDVFIDESDIIHEVPIDEEILPDTDGPNQDSGSDSDFNMDEVDDSEHIFTGHTGELYSVTCSPTDAALVATGGGDDKGFLWQINRGDWASELKGHTDSVSSLGFNHDGTLLATGGFDGTVKIWDVSGNLKHTLDGPEGGVQWIRWHPRGNVLMAGFDESCSVWMWNTNFEFLMSFNGHESSVTCGDFTPDGKVICTGSDDATLRIWNPKSGDKSIHVVRGHPYHKEGITCLAINSTSTIALTGSKDGSIHIVNITTGRVVSTLPSHSNSIESVEFAPSGSWAAIGGMDQLVIWDVEHSLARSTCEHEYGVTCLTWLGASYLATGSGDGVVRLWDSRSGECVRTFRGHSECIQSLSLSANRDHLVSASLDHTARVFDVKGFV